MVGRLRTVNKGVVGQALTPWYTYAYNGVFPLSRTDNLSPGGFIRFTFDSLARLTNTRVSDPLLPHIDYGVEYDSDFYARTKKVYGCPGLRRNWFDGERGNEFRAQGLEPSRSDSSRQDL